MNRICSLHINTVKAIRRLFPSAISKIIDVAPVEGRILKLAMLKYRMTLNGTLNAIDEIFDEYGVNLTPEESAKVFKYLWSLERGEPLPALNDNEAKAVNLIQKVLEFFNNHPDRPLINDDGVYRNVRLDPKYNPTRNIMSDEVYEDIRKGRNLDKYKQMLAEYYTGKPGGLSSYIDSVLKLNVDFVPANPNTHFGPLRKPMGLGLPEGMREKDPIRALAKWAKRAAADLTYHAIIEKDPIVGRIFGLTEDGDGNKYARNELEELIVFSIDGRMVQDMSHLEEVKLLHNELIHLNRGHYDTFDKVAALANSMRLGAVTGLRDLLNSIGTISAQNIMKLSDLTAYYEALRNVFADPKKAIRVGNVRNKFTANFETDSSAQDWFTKVANVFRTYSGRDAIEKASRVFAAELGEVLARRALDAIDSFGPEGAKHAVEFFESLLGDMWKKVRREELINLTRQALMEKVQGNYMENLHPSLLRTGGHPVVRFVFTLQRWAYERASRFTEEAIVPLVERGDLKPLLKQSLGFLVTSAALDPILEYVLNVKPPGLTVEEWAKLDPEEYPEANEELIYHLAAKMSYAGFAGAYSMILENLMGIRFGDEIFPVENPGASLAKDIFVKIVNAFSAQGIRFSTLISLPYEIFTDEVQNLRILKNLDKDKEMLRLYEAYERASGMRRPGLNLVSDVNPFNVISRLEDYSRSNAPTDDEMLHYFMQRVYREKPSLRRPFLLRDPGFLNFARTVMAPDEFYEAYHKAQFEEMERMRRMERMNRAFEAAQSLFWDKIPPTWNTGSQEAP